MAMSSVSVLTNALRLLNLTPKVREHVREGRISAGQAKVLGSTRDAMTRRYIDVLSSLATTEARA